MAEFIVRAGLKRLAFSALATVALAGIAHAQVHNQPEYSVLFTGAYA